MLVCLRIFAGLKEPKTFRVFPVGNYGGYGIEVYAGASLGQDQQQNCRKPNESSTDYPIVHLLSPPSRAGSK
jgi:hypothetical protein